MKKIALLAALPLLLVINTNSALAGVRVGNHSTPYAGVALQQGLDKFGTGIKVYGGYEFMDFDLGKSLVVVGAEAAYDNFSKKNGLSATALSVVANARMSVLDNVDVYAHAGLANTAVKDNGTTTKTGFTLGGGATYLITDKINVFAEVDLYTNLDLANQNVVSLGGEMRF
jgi:opacity protein-like surface antigen